jgi:hypothetical protein
MAKCIEELYEPAIRPARRQFRQDPAVALLFAAGTDPVFLESFLIHFCSLGVGLTQPVESWLVRAGKRCEEVGLPELGRALRSHSKQEAGHHLMMIEDTHALVRRWNARRTPARDAEQLLARAPTRGGSLYRQLHEQTIAGREPFCQIAIEYEIELLPVELGPRLLECCGSTLGTDVLAGLSFLREHITLDVAHSRFNAHHLEKLLQARPEYAGSLARAGATALEAYAAFLGDCIQLTRAETRMAAAGGVLAGCT